MIHVRLMTADDISVGMRLKQQARWNQLEADWRRFLDMEPAGCFVAELDGVPVGTTTTCIFDDEVACVALVLVDERLRGQGVGTALMKHALVYLDGRGVRSIRLDATPLGRPIYEKLGFVAEYELDRYAGKLPPGPPVEGCSTAVVSDLDAIITLDREISGIGRRKMLERFLAEDPKAMRIIRVAGRIEGYLASRPGALAAQIGPCVGRHGVGPTLLRDAWQRLSGQEVFIDVPLSNVAGAVAVAHEMGLEPKRRLLRMCRGKPVIDRPPDYWASSGPEKG